MTQQTYNRRQVLKAASLLTAFLAAPKQMLAMERSERSFASLPTNPDEKRTIAIVGAGVAGLAAAYVAANAGFKVVVFESTDRYGGRSLTLRPDDENYKNWWFDKYNPTRLFPKMYASSYQERADSPASMRQPQSVSGGEGAFAVRKWPGSEKYVELFLNAGPGRIPSSHSTLLELCGEIGVRLEPYTFLSGSNLLASPSFDQGRPVQWREINYSLIGKLAEVVRTAVNDGMVLNGYDQVQILDMLDQLGNLDSNGKFSDSSNVGYMKDPGGWLNPIELNKPIDLQTVLDSDFVGSGDPEQSMGSFIFNSDHITWQPSLMQPIGGMDRIWQQLLMQEIPAGAIDYDPAHNIPAPDRSARGGDVNKVYVGDLVHLSTQITGLSGASGGVATVTTAKGTIKADAVIVTAAPALLSGQTEVPTGISAHSLEANVTLSEEAKKARDYSKMVIPEDMLIANDLPAQLQNALASVIMTPAIKVGTQGKERFWEKENQIYGGISWTTKISSQIWYPCEDFNAPTGILTGAYTRGLDAYYFASLSQEERRRHALEGGESLHDDYADKIVPEFMPTIAWQYMPGQIAGWAAETYEQQCDIYKEIVDLPVGAIFFAGDSYSQTPGWQEGAIASARYAILSLKEGKRSTDPALYGTATVMACPS